MADLEKLVEELSALTVMEAAELSKLLKKSGAFLLLLRSQLLLPVVLLAAMLLLLKRKLNLTLFWLLPATRKSTSSRKSVRSPVSA